MDSSRKHTSRCYSPTISSGWKNENKKWHKHAEIIVNFYVQPQAIRQRLIINSQPTDVARMWYKCDLRTNSLPFKSYTIFHFSFFTFIKPFKRSKCCRQEMHASTCRLVSTCHSCRATKDAKLHGKTPSPTTTPLEFFTVLNVLSL